jgi:hypothetical protein
MRIETTSILDSGGDPTRAMGLEYNMEGIDYGLIAGNTATFSFFCRSSIPGTYSILFRNEDNTWTYHSNYTIDNADTWERKKITFFAEDDPAIFSNLLTTGRMFQLRFVLTSGASNLAPNNELDQWVNTNYVGTVNDTNTWAETIGSTFDVTDVMLNLGSNANEFKRRGVNFHEEFRLARRYFQEISQDTNIQYLGSGSRISNTNPAFTIQFASPMRTTNATVNFSSTSTLSIRYFGNASSKTATLLAFRVYTNYLRWNMLSSFNTSSLESYDLYTSGQRITLEDELT